MMIWSDNCSIRPMSRKWLVLVTRRISSWPDLKGRNIGSKRLLPSAERLLPDLKGRDIGSERVLPSAEGLLPGLKHRNIGANQVLPHLKSLLAGLKGLLTDAKLTNVGLDRIDFVKELRQQRL